MFVSPEDLEAFTGLQRPAAQARFLQTLGMKFVRRPDGTVALRQAELDAHTISKPFDMKPPARPEPRLRLRGIDYPLTPGQQRWQNRIERLAKEKKSRD